MTGAHALHGPAVCRGPHHRQFKRGMAFRAMAGRRHEPPFGFGPEGPGFGPGSGGPGPGGPGGPFGRRRRMRRGDVRAALLVLLGEEPRNGYGLMQEIEQRSNGAWRPSPGAVYPALAQLEDEGLVRAAEADGRKLYELTDAGREHLAEHDHGEPWAKLAEQADTPRHELKSLMMQLGAAAFQVGGAGTDEQVDRARTILVDARKALYRLLAEDDVPAS